jgi:uncharacterized protein (DUF2267 family)
VISSRRLLDRVQQRGGLSPDGAATTTLIVLGELGGCLTWGEAQNLVELLPDPYAQEVWVRSLRSGPRYSPEAFTQAVAEQLSIERPEAEQRCRAVLSVLAELLPAGRPQHVAAELGRFMP